MNYLIFVVIMWKKTLAGRLKILQERKNYEVGHRVLLLVLYNYSSSHWHTACSYTLNKWRVAWKNYPRAAIWLWRRQRRCCSVYFRHVWLLLWCAIFQQSSTLEARTPTRVGCRRCWGWSRHRMGRRISTGRRRGTATASCSLIL